jgi:predicted O-linked N-acetylglucosamine transferase (SPINDLY family)
LRRKLSDRLDRLGVSVDRVIYVAADDDRPTHQARYGEIDIALDTFPFTGASTSFDALWMGVPVITLAGTTFVERMSMAMAHFAGLEELVAEDTSGYVGRSIRLARDLTRLTALRAGLRERLLASPLCDGVSHARSLERAFSEMAAAHSAQ